MRSLLLFFLAYLLPLILSIIPSFFIVFKIGLVFMALLLTGFHLILPHVLGQSPSKIPLHPSQIFLVYLKVPSLAYFFSLFQGRRGLYGQSGHGRTTFQGGPAGYTSGRTTFCSNQLTNLGVSTQNIDFRMQKRAKHTSQMALVFVLRSLRS